MSSSHEPDVETAHEISNTPEPGAVQTRTREVEQERLPRMSFPVAASLLAGLGLALVAVSLRGFFPPAWTWNHLVVHGVVEALGAFAALTLAGLLLLVLGRERSFNHRLWIACAFIGMGVLDGFHASQFPGLPFVWFRSVATLTGGFFFALAWLPDRVSAFGLRRWLPLTVAAAATLFGAGSIAVQRALPAMMTGGDFTPVAKAINLIGGLLFLAASARFLLLYRDRRVFDDFLFAGLCLLFGVAGLLFPFSRLWNAEWWFWHFLRLLAYIVVISWMLVLYQRALTGLRRARDELELRVEERTRTLAKTNGLMQSTLGSIGDAVIATDQNGSVTFLNAVAQELTGWTQEEAQGKSLDLVFDIINQETRQPVENPVKKVFRAGKVVGLADHTVLISRDRREFDIEDSAAPIVTDEGERIGVVLVFRDVTERRRIEEERDRFFTLSRDMIGIAGFDGYFKSLNPAWEKTLGFTPEELLAAPYLDFVHPEDRDATTAEAAKLAGGRETVSFENRYRCKDGSYKWILWSCTPSVGHQLIYAVAHDITERKRAEEALLFNQQRLAGMVDSAMDAVITVDDAQGIVLFNRAAEEMFRCKASEALGQPIDRFIPERFRDRHREHVREFAATGVTSRSMAVLGCVSGRRADGEEFPIEASLSQIKVGEAHLFTVILRDITERKRAGEKLRKAHDELELRVQERTAELAFANEILLVEITQRQQAEEKARRLNRVYSVLSEINQIIVRAQDQMTLFDQACQAAVKQGEFRMAWIGMLDEAGRSVLPVARAGIEDGYVEDLHLRLDAGTASEGPTGTALREDRHFICNDIERDPRMAPWRERALRLGYRSSASFPLRKSGRVVGAFNLYAAEPQFFDDDEIHLLDELAADISFALESIQMQEQHARAEEALRQSEARLRGLFENATLGIYRSTQEGRFLDVNPALVSMLGYNSREELLAVSIAENVYANPADLERLVKEYAGAETFENVPLQWKRKDGKPISILLSGRAVRDAGGALAYFESFVEDVTERQALEKQFYAAQKFEAIGHLAGGIAHDFNNVLGAILGWAELGLDLVPEDSKVRKNFRVIVEQAQHAAGLTRQLLAFARRQHMEPRVLNLNNSVREVSTLLGSVIGRDIELKTSLAPNLSSVLADPTHLEQVLMNLCVNARDAMPRGGKLTIETKNAEVDEDYCRLHPYAQPGHYVQLSVSDTGVGMDAATLDHVFEPFFTTKEPGKGTGLGLATVYGIVKQHGGFIHAYSELGQGTTFHIYFPACAQAPLNEKKAEAPALRGGTETILLAEDSVELAALARDALEKAGYSVLCASDGEEAVSLFELHRDRVALLVFDVVMPVLNGPDAYLRIRALRDSIPALFTSGHSFESPALSSLVERGAELLQKPYSTKALLLKVRELLDRQCA